MSAAGRSLWPPNHQLVQVAIVTASDALSGLAPGSFTVTGTSVEPIDPSDPAIVITPNDSGGFVAQLQAERLGSGSGRLHTLTAAAACRSNPIGRFSGRFAIGGRLPTCPTFCGEVVM